MLRKILTTSKLDRTTSVFAEVNRNTSFLYVIQFSQLDATVNFPAVFVQRYDCRIVECFIAQALMAWSKIWVDPITLSEVFATQPTCS